MARRAAKIQSRDRRSMIGPARNGAHEEELVRGHRPLHDIAAGQSKGSFQIQRAQYLAMQDGTGNVGGVLGERFDAAISEAFLDFVPIAMQPHGGLVVQGDPAIR